MNIRLKKPIFRKYMNVIYKTDSVDVNLNSDRIWQIEQSCQRNESLGEKKVAGFLRQNNTPFIQEHYFEDLINPLTGLLLFFDFYLPTGNTVIEVQGEYHFESYGDEQRLKKQKSLDLIKKEYCKRKKIRYVAIKSRFGKVDLCELNYGLRKLKTDLFIGYGRSIIKPKKNSKKSRCKR
jgi:hypothetical protein